MEMTVSALVEGVGDVLVQQGLIKALSRSVKPRYTAGGKAFVWRLGCKIARRIGMNQTTSRHLIGVPSVPCHVTRRKAEL
jgi:hypothetical protein